MSIDLRAVGLGALVAIVAAFPGLLLGSILDVTAFALIVLVAFVLGGAVAASKRPDAPFTHGLLAAAAAWIGTSALSIAIRLAKGDDIRPAAYAFNLVVASGCGCLGALVAQRRTP
ncbi:MAG: hypothetical protein ACR2LQ_06335 [Acidimicrobiales bacterium]